MKKLKSYFIIAILSIILSNEAFSGKIEFISSSATLEQPFVYVVTNRPAQYDSLSKDYFPNTISTVKPLSYFKVFRQQENWLVQELSSVNDFNTGNRDYRNWLVYVHGDSQTPDLAFMRGMQLQEEYRVNVIVFSWPSKDPKLGGIQNFNNSKNNIEQGTSGFIQFLRELDGWKNNQAVTGSFNMSLFLHSLGNYYLERIASDNLIPDYGAGVFDNLILNAAAIDQRNHDAWLKDVNIQKRIFINSNRKDMTLKGLNLLTSASTQLGEQAIDGFSPNAVYINFSSALKNELNFGLLHGYYVGVIPAKSKNIYNYYQDIFNGCDVDLSNPEMFILNDTVPVYEIIF